MRSLYAYSKIQVASLVSARSAGAVRAALPKRLGNFKAVEVFEAKRFEELRKAMLKQREIYHHVYAIFSRLPAPLILSPFRDDLRARKNSNTK